MLVLLITVAGLPIWNAQAPSEGETSKETASTTPGEFATQLPRTVGADPVPDLSLPKTVLSSVDSLIGAGGVIQTSPDNITLYNLGVKMRLLGSPLPHDELLGPDLRVLSAWSFWKVEAQVANGWIPLISRWSNFTVLGTNSTGTFVVRAMEVGGGLYSGEFRIVYKALSDESLKWDLEFSPSISARYRMVYSWHNLTKSFDLSPTSRQLTVNHPRASYTLSWKDVPTSLNATAEATEGVFSLFIDLGVVTSGSRILIDPSFVASSSLSQATAFPYQHRVYQDPKTGYYWVFYNTVGSGSTSLYYKYSTDGVTWSGAFNIAGMSWTNAPVSSPGVFFLGDTVVVARGTRVTATGLASVWTSPIVVVGKVAGTQINWGPIQTDVYRVYFFCNTTSTSSCYITGGIEYVSVALDSSGRIWLSFNEWYYTSPDPANPCGVYNESYLYIVRIDQSGAHLDMAAGHNNGSKGFCYPYYDELWRSVILPADSPSGSGTRAIFQGWYHTYSSDLSTVTGTWITLHAQWSDGQQFTDMDTIEPIVADEDEFSAVYDAEDGTYVGTHVVYRGTNGNITYAHRSAYGAGWTYEKDIFNGQVSSPTVTADLSTNDVYAFGIQGSTIAMRVKTLAGSFADRAAVYPVKGRTNPAFLQSGFASASATNSNYVMVVWTEPAGGGSYNVWFSSVPIQTVWSPYGLGHEPWDGNGLVPYGQYFANLGESVSPSTGLLTIRQTDLSIPGRGLNLEISRVYTEPPTFLSGNPYNFESSYGFRDDSFSSGWSQITVGTFTVASEGSDGDILTITGTPGSSGDDYRTWARYGLFLDTTAFPYVVVRWKTSAASCTGLGVGIVVYFSDSTSQVVQPTDCTSFSTAWITKAYALPSGKFLTTIELYANDNPNSLSSGTYSVYYDYVAITGASIGNGWTLNFPWFRGVQKPSYIHLWDGQGYRIPATFWDGNSATFENHQGEHFRVVRRADGTISLYTKTGISYNFDTGHRLVNIIDTTGNNIVTFTYDAQNRLSRITDTIQRAILFCYDAGLPMLLRSINQTTGTCSSGTGSVRGVLFSYDSKLSLVSVTDTLGRVTGYQYSASAVPIAVRPWILSRITYPTSWYTDYTYSQFTQGVNDQVYTYRVYQQTVNPSSGPTIRKFEYAYTQGLGDQVTGSTVKTYNGTSTNPATFTEYAFSFAGVTRNVTDANHRLVSGVQQRFGVHGEVVREINLVTALNVWYYTKSQPSSGWNSDPNWFYGSDWSIARDIRTYGQEPWYTIQNWQDSSARWIWSDDQAATAASDGEKAWFRTVFYAPAPGTFYIDITADDIYKVYVDGSLAGQDQVVGGWTAAETWIVTLTTAGYHVLAVEAQNTCPSCGGPQPAGLLVSLRQAVPGQVVVRSDRSVGSYTNVYRYDPWGTPIYTSRVIDSSSNLRHESFQAYYNNGLPLGFYSFIDTFSNNEWRGTDNPNWSTDNTIRTPAPCCQARVNRHDMFVRNGWMHFEVGGYPVDFSFYSDEIPISSTYPRWLVSFDWKAHSDTGASSVTQLDFRLKFSNGTIVYVSQLAAGGATDLSGSYSADLAARINDATSRGNTWVKLVWHIDDGWDADWRQTADIDNVQVSPGGTFSNSFYADGGAPGPTGLNTWLMPTARPSGVTWSSVVNWNGASGWVPALPSLDYTRPYPPWGTIAGWTDSLAQWIWWNRDAWVSSTSDPVWFRRVFTLTAPTTLTIEITADNYYDLHLDGVYLGSNGDWTNRETYSRSLGVGDHLLAVYAENFGSANPAGLLLSARDSSGQVIFRSEGASWPNIVVPAGSAELKDRTGLSPLESYSSYHSWGGVKSTRNRYDSSTGLLWLSTTITYDNYGNPKTLTDPQGTVSHYSYSSLYDYAYLTHETRIATSTLFSDGFSGTIAPQWTVQRGTWALENGELSGEGTSASIVSTDAFPSDRTFQVRMKTILAGSSPWYTAWSVGKYVNDCSRATLTLHSTGTLEFNVAVACSVTGWAAATSLSVFGWHKVRMVFVGDNAKVYVDDSLYFDVTDSKFSQLGDSKIELASWGPSHSHFDDVLVEGVKGEISSLDDFNDGDYSGWTVGSGSWAVETGELSSPSTGEAWIGTGDVTWPITLVEAGVRWVSGQLKDFSIDFLWDDGKDHYRMQTWDGYQTLRLYKFHAGSYAQLATATLSGIDPAQWHTWKITMAGGRIRLSIDEVERISYTDSSPYTTGKVRFRTVDSHVHFDDVRVERANSVSTLFTYDTNTGYLVSSRDPMGNTTSYQYDILGRTTRITLPPNGLDFVQYTYNDQANYVEMTNENGWKTREYYDGLGRLLRTERFGVTSAKLRLYVTDSSNMGGDFYKTSNSWSQSTVTWISAPAAEGPRIATLGAVSKNTWVEIDVTSFVNGDGVFSFRITSTSSDLAKYTSKEGTTANRPQLVITLTNQAQTRVLTFNPTDDSYVDASSSTSNFGTSAELKVDNSPVQHILLKFSVTGIGSYSTETLKYDWANRAISTTDSVGRVFTTGYDALGRVVDVVKPDGNITRALYDNLNSWTRLTDEDGNNHCSIGDRAGRVISVVEQASIDCRTGLVTNYYYDEIGNLGRVTNSKLQTTLHDYDNLGRLTGTTYADGKSETYTYDSNGSIRKKVDRKGDQTLYAYDSLSRLQNVTYCGSPITSESYTYDLSSRPVKVESLNATLTYKYDARNRLTEETYAVNAGSQTVNLGCPAGSTTTVRGTSQTYTVSYYYKGEVLQRIRYPDGLNLNYTYDGLGRVASVFKPGSSPYAKFNYFRDNQVRDITFGNGLVGNYTYDLQGRPAGIALRNGGTLLLSLNYQYHRTGTVSSITGQSKSSTGVTLTVDERYTYDLLQRLTNATVRLEGTTTSLWYEYDSLGNRQRQSMNGQLTSYTYNPLNNQLESWSRPGNSTSYTYDDNGNLASRTVISGTTTAWSYTWNVQGRLLKVTRDSITQGTYAYDAMGRLIESVEASTTRFYAYMGTETLYEKAGSTSTDYVYAGGLRIAKVTGLSTVKYYHTDHLGSTRLITSSTKAVIFSDGYQPFGQDNGTPTGSEPERNKFTGKPYSSSTGLYYYFQRWYDPEIGRFISQDPILGHLSSPQTLNTYTYVVNSPISASDPTGLDCFSSLGDLGNCLWDSTIGAGIDSYNWYQTASEEDRRAFWIGVGVAVGIGVVVGLSCVFAGCAGLALLAIGGLTGVAGSLWAGVAYNLAGGKSEGGVHATMFWGGLAAGISFSGAVSIGSRLLASSSASRLAANRANGLSLEEYVAANYGEVRNVGAGQIRIVGSRGTYIPDFRSGAEAKAVQYLSQTKQMQIAIQNAIRANQPFRIYTLETTRLSGPMSDLVHQGIIDLVRVPFYV